MINYKLQNVPYVPFFNLTDFGQVFFMGEDDIPISTSEKLVREDTKKLIENDEEIRKLKKEVVYVR